ncbi:right-handed parallel beta-helix repeat-containing protein [Nitrospira sp. KM1]|uniref:right-handed parallel beta-helix repeat-containing protein n=1 Tax=Nitrospira sp. KM1 TaxID=1936990 RepID=UPI0015662AF8|nr:right-handed parallel beta-helix repeat-containing protein [Nitrospira sp. KM1]
MNGNDSYAIAFINRSYVIFDNVEVRSNTQHGIYFANTASSSNLVIQNCHFTDIVGNAIQFGESGRNTDFDNVTIVNNKFDSIGGGGIVNAPIDVGSAQNWNNLTIANNTFTNMGTSSANSAIDFLMSAGTSATMTNLTITGNVISQTNVGETTTAVPSIRLVRSPMGSAAENRFSNVDISDNTITTTDMGMIFLAHAMSPARIANNAIYNLASNAAVAVFYSDGVEVSGNTIRNIAPLAVSKYIDGAGLDLEVNSNLSVHGNTITGNLGHASQVNSGQGIYIYNDKGSLVFSNLLVGNKLGIMSDAGVSMTTFANNTIVNSSKYGIWASPFANYGHWFVNNIITGSGEYGILTAGVTDQKLTTNLFFGNRSGNYGKQIGGVSDLTVDPLYIGPGNFELQAASPAIRAGTWWGPPCVDLRGRSCFQGRMALGVYQPSQYLTNPSGLTVR